MTAPSGKRSGAGFRHCQILALNSDGYPNASSTAAYEGINVSGARVLELNDPEPRQIVYRGDDRVFGLDSLPADQPMTGQLTAGKVNDEVGAAVSDAESFTVGQMKMIAFGHDKRGDEPDVAIVAYRQARDYDPSSANYGKRVWEMRLLPKVQVVEMEAGFGDDPDERQYSLYPQFVTKHLWGESLAEGTEGVTQAQGFRGVTEYKPKFVAWKGDGATTEFSFPTGSPAVNTDKITVWVDGTEQTSGLTEATDGLTFTTTETPTTGAIVVAAYEVE
jgi:hypothetical protein